MKRTLIFESHGASLDNEKNIASGQFDTPLSEKGRRQAQTLGMRHQGTDAVAIYCSDLQRSKETAEIAFADFHVPLIQDTKLREWDYGSFNGRPSSQIEQMKSLYIYDPFPKGESLQEAVKRIMESIKTFPQGKIILVGHRALYYTLEHLFRKRSFEDLLKEEWQWQPGRTYTQTT